MTIQELDVAIAFIENNENYYTGFRHVIETCASARTMKSELWNIGEITDSESLSYSERISKAREQAIKTHQEWVIKLLKASQTVHTVESLASTIYNLILY